MKKTYVHPIPMGYWWDSYTIPNLRTAFKDFLGYGREPELVSLVPSSRVRVDAGRIRRYWVDQSASQTGVLYRRIQVDHKIGALTLGEWITLLRHVPMAISASTSNSVDFISYVLFPGMENPTPVSFNRSRFFCNTDSGSPSIRPYELDSANYNSFELWSKENHETES